MMILEYICIGQQWIIYALVNTERQENTLKHARADVKLTERQRVTNCVLILKRGTVDPMARNLLTAQ
jgi:hypothetical protein